MAAKVATVRSIITTRREGTGWAAAVFVTVFVLALIAAPPFVGDGMRHVIMLGFSGVCHQIPLRSPHVAGIQLAVCDRCLGIYTALAFASILFPLLNRWDAGVRRHTRALIVAALLVPGLDWAGEVVGLWSNTPASRLLTGAVFGTVAGYLFTGAVVALVSERNEAAATGVQPTSREVEPGPRRRG